MGIVCNFLRVSNETINYLLANPDISDNYLSQNYASVYGKFHRENNTVFYTDKAWSIALYLLKESNSNLRVYLEGNFLTNDLTDKYIRPEEVLIIYSNIKHIAPDTLKKIHDSEKMKQNYIYGADSFTIESWDYIKEHIVTIQNAFTKAAACNEGIILYFS